MLISFGKYDGNLFINVHVEILVFMEALNAYEFERHAGSKTNHPNNHIYFENGKTIYQIVQELKSTPGSMLFNAVETMTGSQINQKAFLSWKGSVMNQ